MDGLTLLSVLQQRQIAVRAIIVSAYAPGSTTPPGGTSTNSNGQVCLPFTPEMLVSA